MNPHYALITGSGSGIGKALAFECAKRNYNLLLISLPGTDLNDTVKSLQSIYSVKVYSLGLDLTQAENHKSILEFIHEHQLKISLLINNAGFGSVGAFEKESYLMYAKMLQLNIQNTVLLSHTLLPVLLQHKGAHILNIGSAGGFFDMPYKLVYSSSKRFIFSFSRGLREELKSLGIGVSVVCPGGVNTNEEVKLRVARMGWAGKKTTLEPEEVAFAAMEGVRKNKAVILPGISAKSFFFFSKVLPYPIKLKLVGLLFKRNL